MRENKPRDILAKHAQATIRASFEPHENLCITDSWPRLWHDGSRVLGASMRLNRVSIKTQCEA